MDNLLPICVFFFYLFFSPGGQLSKCVSASYKKKKTKTRNHAQTGNQKATATGFEPARAEPNRFRIYLLNHSDTLSPTIYGPLAQLVERWSNKPLVVGSIPTGTILFFGGSRDHTWWYGVVVSISGCDPLDPGSNPGTVIFFLF